jgi:hypothetical protein
LSWCFWPMVHLSALAMLCRLWFNVTSHRMFPPREIFAGTARGDCDAAPVSSIWATACRGRGVAKMMWDLEADERPGLPRQPGTPGQRRTAASRNLLRDPSNGVRAGTLDLGCGPMIPLDGPPLAFERDARTLLGA